jgi:hypothetical protein
MEQLPSFPSHPFHDSVRRCDGKRYHQNERCESDGDERALGDILQDLIEREELIEIDVRGEMQESIEEREQSDHSSKPREPGPAGELTQGCNGESDDNEAKSPDPGLFGDVLDGVSAQLSHQGTIDQEPCGDEREQKYNHLSDGDFPLSSRHDGTILEFWSEYFTQRREIPTHNLFFADLATLREYFWETL